MTKINAWTIIIYTLAVIIFGTWQLFRGHLEAAFSTIPFLLITYLYVKHMTKKQL